MSRIRFPRSQKGPKTSFPIAKGIARRVKEAKRAEAEARQAERDARTPAQQLARLDAGGFAAVKERAQLASPSHSAEGDS